MCRPAWAIVPLARKTAPGLSQPTSADHAASTRKAIRSLE